MTDQTPSLVQQLNLGSLVELYELDLTGIGFAVVLYFTPSQQSGQNIMWNGNEYVSAAVSVTGFKKNSDGTSVSPELVVPNIDKAGAALLNSYDGLIGAKITRRRTFSQFLDFLEDGVTVNPNADPLSQFMPEIWYVEQKREHNRVYIKFNLSSPVDLQGRYLPNRRIWKDLCERTYRVPDGAGGFLYNGVTCPYVGGSYFDIFGVATTAANDYCGKSFKHCLLRFPSPDNLPGWFFPGVQRVQGYVGSS